MKNAKAFVLVALISVAGFALAKVCCQGSCEVAAPVESTEVAPEVVAEVVPSVEVETEEVKAKRLADEKLAADAAQPAQEVVVADKE